MSTIKGFWRMITEILAFALPCRLLLDPSESSALRANPSIVLFSLTCQPCTPASTPTLSFALHLLHTAGGGAATAATAASEQCCGCVLDRRHQLLSICGDPAQSTWLIKIVRPCQSVNQSITHSFHPSNCRLIHFLAHLRHEQHSAGTNQQLWNPLTAT